MATATLAQRAEQLARDWGVQVGSSQETASSLVAFGTRGDQPVVLKVVRSPGDEWRVGAVITAFAGHGMVRALDHTDGAVLLEQLSPGASLSSLSLAGRDSEATAILADVQRQLSAGPTTLAGAPTVADWARGFAWYLTSGDTQIDRALVERAQECFLRLANSERHPRLLHGDLQHYNVLYDQARGWLAIDPKGVIGEPARTVGWAFAQSVLSAIWEVEDGYPIQPQDAGLALARLVEPMLPSLP